MRLYRRYRAPPEVFIEETWRLEISVRAYGELRTASPNAGQQLQCVLYPGKGGLRSEGEDKERRRKERGVCSVAGSEWTIHSQSGCGFMRLYRRYNTKRSDMVSFEAFKR